MQSDEMIRRLHGHRMWCNRRLREAVGELTDAQLQQTFDMGRGSLWHTLAHLYGAEYVWLATLTGETRASLPTGDSFETRADLFNAWDALDKRWQAYLRDLTPDQLNAPITKRAAGGKTHTTPTHDALLHVCTHAQYTTAQAAKRAPMSPKPSGTISCTSHLGTSRKAAV